MSSLAVAALSDKTAMSLMAKRESISRRLEGINFPKVRNPVFA